MDGKLLSGIVVVWGNRGDLQGVMMVKQLLGKGKSFKLIFLLVFNAHPGATPMVSFAL